MSQSRPVGPPASSPGSADDTAAVLARSSAWTREAAPVLAAIEFELRRTEEVRKRWDASSAARRGGPPPRAVVALLGRRAEQVHHRETLRAAMVAVRSAPVSEPALATAWQQIRDAQEMLRILVSSRGSLTDPVEAAVLRLVLDGGPAATSVADRSTGRGPRAATPSGPVGGTAANTRGTTTSDAADRSVRATSRGARDADAVSEASEAGEGLPSVPFSTGPEPGAVVPTFLLDEAASDAGTESSGRDARRLLAAPYQSGFDTAEADQERPADDGPGPAGTPPSDPTPAASSISGSASRPPAARDAVPAGTMLTFRRPSSIPESAESEAGSDAESEAESDAGSDAGSTSDVPCGAGTEAEAGAGAIEAH